MMTLKARYREPYSARHSFVSWNLMIGKNLLWVAKQHGHSVSTMLVTYGAWIEGSQAEDLQAIKRAMAASPRSASRQMAVATYISVLVRAHPRNLSPLPKDELMALNQSVAEVRVTRRNLDQLWRLAHQGWRHLCVNRTKSD